MTEEEIKAMIAHYAVLRMTHSSEDTRKGAASLMVYWQGRLDGLSSLKAAELMMKNGR